MNKPSSRVKSSINDGLNKQSKLLGKMNPPLLPSPLVCLNPVFLEYASLFIIVLREIKSRRQKYEFFWSYFTKKQKLFFIE